jgi:HCOMODA/2-hydroxy-3-carboxy-muconic semialdehyde decarboxylase
MSLSAQRRDLVEAARVLSRLGLVTAYGHVSVRAGASMLITPAADLATVTESSVVDVPLDLLPDKPLNVPPGRPLNVPPGRPLDVQPGRPLDVPPGRPLPAPLPGPGLPAGAPAEAWAHLALYRMRPDARAIARAQPPGAFAAAAAVTALPLLHGQAAWLGESVPVHDSAHLLRSADLAARAAASLPAGEALLLRGNGALTLGRTPGLAVARMWLLSAACDASLSALAAGAVKPLTAAEIASWRAVADDLLPRLWQHLRCRAPGESPDAGELRDRSQP